MKNIVLGILVGLVLGVIGAWLVLHHREEKGEEKKESKEESRVQHNTNGETFLKLDKETQERCGLKVAPSKRSKLIHS